MKFIAQVVFYMCLSQTVITPPQDKGWRGIVPLHSTRADVERLLGKPNTKLAFYDDEEGRAHIIYQSRSCEENKGEGWNVPLDTVVSIRIDFANTDRAISDFPIDLTRYEKRGGGHVPGVVYYTNRDEGISYETSYGKVRAVEYGGTTANAHLRCPASLKPPALFSSSELTPAGKKLLDSFVLRLKREPEAGGLVNLNQENKTPDEAESMKRSVEEYLRCTHDSIRDRLAIGLTFQRDDMEFLIFRKDQKHPLRFPDK